MKRQQRTSLTKSVRTKYGLTQEQLALYLDITVGLLKMIELDRRELPLAALLKLNKLALFEIPSQPKPTNTASNASIEKEKRKLRLKKQNLEKKLEEMQIVYNAAVNGAALAQHFLGEAPVDKGEELMLQLL
jgi:transcriptional regulator with XRE-family HTH domain